MKLPRFLKSIWGSFSTSGYPNFLPGTGSRFDRNADNPLCAPDPMQGMLTCWSDPQHRVLMHSTVMACVRLISGTISTLPLHFYERLPDGSRRLAAEHPLYSLIHSIPNADMTAKTFWQAYVASLLLNGEAYGEKKLGTLGRLVAIDYLDFNRVSWTAVDGVRVWRYMDLNGQQRVIPRERLFRTIGFTLDGINGLSAIRYGAMMFNSAQLAEVAANNTFRKGLMPTVYFKYPKVLRKEQREEARAAIKKISGALNAGDPAILEAEMETGTIGINPNDAQLLESRGWSVEEICRWFGVPPFMVGHTLKTTSWGSGLEQMNLGFLAYCLRDHLSGIEQAIFKDLISLPDRPQYYAEFAIDALLRADSAGRAALYASAAQNGWMTRAEIRELENLPVIEGSDELTAQSNLLPLDKLGAANPNSAQPLQDAMKNFLGLIEEKSA
jgi:HK97 family phage portal protein